MWKKTERSAIEAPIADQYCHTASMGICIVEADFHASMLPRHDLESRPNIAERPDSLLQPPTCGAHGCGIEMPITEQVNAILRGQRPPRDAIRELMERSLKSE